MTPTETLDWLAQQHYEQCREVRPVQDWIRKMKAMLPDQTKSKWQQYSMRQHLPKHRTGWAGVWDALKSAITGKERHSYLEPVTITFYAKHDSDVSFTNMQMEHKDNT